MTLPASGPITLFQIADEYGLAHTTSFPTGFYGKPGLPASGPMSFADCYGKSNVAFTPDGGTVTKGAVLPTVAQAPLTCTLAATWTFGALPSGVTADHTSGFSGTSITFSCSDGLGLQHSFAVTGVSNGITRNFTVQLTSLSS